MSKHDRGAFKELLERAKAAGRRYGVFIVDHGADDEDDNRWQTLLFSEKPTFLADSSEVALTVGAGRTGEEALRALVAELESRERMS